MKKERRFLVPVLLALLLTAAELVLAVLLIRNLGGMIRLVTGAETLAQIFGQLRSARIVPPVFLPLGLWLIFCLSSARSGWSRKRTLLLALPLGLLLFACVLCFSVVNGVRFGSVLLSLIRYASRGLFDVL